MKNAVAAILVAGALALSAGGSTLAAGKVGGAGGADEFVISLPDEAPNGAGEEDAASLFTPGCKLGVQGGSDD
jgi:hypothetical protein